MAESLYPTFHPLGLMENPIETLEPNMLCTKLPLYLILPYQILISIH